MWKLIHPGQKQAGFLIQQTLFPHLDLSGKKISKAVSAIVISSYTNIYHNQMYFKTPDLQCPWFLNLVTLGGLKLSINL